MCLAAREVMLRIVKLLRSEEPAGVGGTLNFTSCVSTILHSGSAAALLGEAKLHGILKKKTSYSTMFVQQEV